LKWVYILGYNNIHATDFLALKKLNVSFFYFQHCKDNIYMSIDASSIMYLCCIFT